MNGRDLARLAGALLLGAALAFPVGLMLGRTGDGVKRSPAGERSAGAVRDVFSPALRSDPWFVERQREGVVALEQHCARTGQSCPEAQAARRALAELEAGD
jgi:hypothetical protein